MQLMAASRDQSAMQHRRVETGASLGKTLFTINYIDEEFLGLSHSYGWAR